MTKTDILSLSDLRTFTQRVEATIAAAERGEQMAVTLAPILRGISGAGATAQSSAFAQAAPKRRGRPPGVKNKVHAAATPARAAEEPKAPKAQKATRASKANGGRRSSEQVERDDAALLDYIRTHPNERSEDIMKRLGLAKPNLASGLHRLRDSGAIKMKGLKRGATYTAA